jgi:hypothetical protein
MHRRLWAAALALGVLVGAPSLARAHGGGSAGGAQLPSDPPAVTPDGEKAKAEIAALASQKDARLKAAVGAALDKAKKALGRAHGASLAGDAEGAKVLSRVALAWAKAARGVARATETEARADAAQAKVKDLKEKVARAKALVTETESRKRQLATEIARAEADQKKQGAAAAESEKRRVDKAAPSKPNDKKKAKKP